VKRRDLLSRIGRAAKKAEKFFGLQREGGNHEIWLCGTSRIVVPRHGEINELTARGILKDLEIELGKDWWR
jgi:mRNA interferase HicA